MNKSINKILALCFIGLFFYPKIIYGADKPNLAPYKPSGWSDKIVVSSRTGTTVDSTLHPEDNLYIDWAVINDGSAPVTKPFYIYLGVDLQLIKNWYIDPTLDPGWYVSLNDFSLGTLSPGLHTLILLVDTTTL